MNQIFNPLKVQTCMYLLSMYLYQKNNSPMCYYNLEQTEMTISSGYGPLSVPKMFQETSISHHLIRS